MDMKFESVDIKVDGEQLTVNAMDLRISADLNSEMDHAAAWMAYWGSVLAAAKGELERADGAYRAWRGEATQSILAKDPKMAEWKVRETINAHPRFMDYKKAQAACQRNVTLLETRYEAFKMRASLIQSKGARARSEWEKTGMTTPVPKAPKKAKVRAGEDTPVVAAVRERLKSK